MAKEQIHNMDEVSRTGLKDSTAAESLVEGLGQLNLNLDSKADTKAETTRKVEDTSQIRYNLRSRNKNTIQSKPTRPEDSSTGSKQAASKTYLLPHLRGKPTRHGTISTTAHQAATDSQLPTHPPIRQHRMGKKSNNLNANAPTFQPQVANRVPPTSINFVPGTAFHQPTRPASASSSTKKKDPYLNSLKRPSPTEEYLTKACQAAQTLDEPRRLLVVLDLNGTLLYRTKQKGGSTFIARPRVNEFIAYLLRHHKVMVWSSAKPENVRPMCKKLFDQEQHDRLVAVWARDTLHISQKAYSHKVKVYKQLSWLWKDACVQATSNPAEAWDQSNTVLVDDSVHKAASEPHNLIRLEEFENREDQRETDVLGKVVKYLETLKYEKNVSAFMRVLPFTYNAGEMFDWQV